MMRTPILAGLFVLVASAALAQTNAAGLGVNLDPGLSGSSSGLLSGGGTISSSLHGHDPRSEAAARTPSPKAGKTTENASDTKLRSKAATKSLAAAEAGDDLASDKPRARTKARKETKAAENREREKRSSRFYAYPSSYPYVFSRGFASFGSPRGRY